MKLRFPIIFNLFLILLLPVFAQGSACCGGNFSGPALITGDDKALLSQSLSYSQIDTDVESSGLWRKRDQVETSKILNVQMSHIFWDRWQAGLSVPVIQRSRAQTSSSGVGDVAASFGYEYLPDWDYHPIRPKGIGYMQLIVPTGNSIQESDSRYQLEARGRGFWALGIGTMLTKNLSRWDLFSSFDLHRSFEKNYASTQGSGILKPGWGGSAGWGAGFHWNKVRLGSSLTLNYEDPINIQGSPSSQGSPQRFVTASASLSYLFENEWSLTAQYSDQG
ncbi:MAG: hypothetical protein ACXWC9_09030, partial [Pseudobdellovibrionaceae bacterium]